ncbi:hypothetical protein B0H11DRAFT_2267465 [Mycena galericulata]|nr:hypothetical protein B0H11DRAFT_2267465 [Mycena galericulata]
MSPWCDDDLQDLFLCRRCTAAHWRALEPGAERGTHGHTHTTAHSRDGAVGGRTCRARELCRCGAARLGLAPAAHPTRPTPEVDSHRRHGGGFEFDYIKGKGKTFRRTASALSSLMIGRTKGA